MIGVKTTGFRKTIYVRTMTKLKIHFQIATCSYDRSSIPLDNHARKKCQNASFIKIQFLKNRNQQF